MKKCYPKYAYYIYYLLSGVIFLFSIGPWIINTNDLLSIKISCSITMLVFSLLLFFSALWNGQFYTIDKGFIVCKNCFCVIQKISIEDAICIIQELPTYFNWMTSTSKKWICIYCKTVILDLRQAVQIHERKKEYKLFTQIIIMK